MGGGAGVGVGGGEDGIVAKVRNVKEDNSESSNIKPKSEMIANSVACQTPKSSIEIHKNT